MATQELAPRGGKFSTFNSIAVGNSASAYSDPCAPSKDCSTVAKNGSKDNAHTSNPFNKGEKLGREPNTLV